MAKPTKINTQASVQDAAGLFRRAMRVSWVSENVTGRGTQFETPAVHAFDGLAADPPSHSVVAMIGGGGHETQQSAVCLHVWDRGDYRDLVLVVQRDIAALGIKANLKIRRFETALQALDSSMQRAGT
jgi:hypothetical protein